MAEDLYIVFDGPPSHESGRFVEVEIACGKSVRAGKWEEYPGKPGLWRLGPFTVPAPPPSADPPGATVTVVCANGHSQIPHDLRPCECGASTTTARVTYERALTEEERNR